MYPKNTGIRGMCIRDGEGKDYSNVMLKSGTEERFGYFKNLV